MKEDYTRLFILILGVTLVALNHEYFGGFLILVAFGVFS